MKWEETESNGVEWAGSRSGSIGKHGNKLVMLLPISVSACIVSGSGRVKHRLRPRLYLRKNPDYCFRLSPSTRGLLLPIPVREIVYKPSRFRPQGGGRRKREHELISSVVGRQRSPMDGEPLPVARPTGKSELCSQGRTL